MGLAEEVERRLGADPALAGRVVTVAVMGCRVNGPEEARHADYGIAAGAGEGVLFDHGERVETLPEGQLVDALLALVRAAAAELAGRAPPRRAPPPPADGCTSSPAPSVPMLSSHAHLGARCRRLAMRATRGTDRREEPTSSQPRCSPAARDRSRDARLSRRLDADLRDERSVLTPSGVAIAGRVGVSTAWRAPIAA